jgi:hypothetical protein
VTVGGVRHAEDDMLPGGKNALIEQIDPSNFPGSCCE